MTQTAFYKALGIKKPYYYDIVSGRVNPPPPQLQFKAIEILQPDERSQETFFDLAAKERGEMPADVLKFMADNPDAIDSIRKRLKQVPSTDQENKRMEL